MVSGDSASEKAGGREYMPSVGWEMRRKRR